MWKTEHSEDTVAEPEAVWRVWTDVEGWSSWNPGIAWARLEGPFQAGTVGRTKPAKGPEGTFTVANVEPGTSFVNEAKMAGARLRFLHRVERLGDGRSRVTMGASMAGPLASLYGMMFGRNIKAYMPTAVRQLVAKAEGRPLG